MTGSGDAKSTCYRLINRFRTTLWHCSIMASISTSSSGYRYTFVLKHDPADWPYDTPSTRTPEQREAHRKQARRDRRETAKAEGRCTLCKNPHELGKALCTLHLGQVRESNRKYAEANRDNQDFKNRISQLARERREKAREAGLCTAGGCKSQSEEGGAQCDRHRAMQRESNQRRKNRGIPEEARLREKEKARVKNRRRYEEAKSGIRCLKCEDPPAPGKVRCDIHLALHNEQSKSQDARRKARALEQGLCTRCCKQPAREGSTNCQSCADKARESEKHKYARRKAAGLRRARGIQHSNVRSTRRQDAGGQEKV